MTLAGDYLARHGGDRILASIELGRELMRGDVVTFKQGYTADNAALAAQDLFGLDDDELRAVRHALMEGTDAPV